MQHEIVVPLKDESIGLRGFIAIHNRNMGPAVGGTRFFPYHNEQDAMDDVLRLSEAMTYKCAVAGVRYGGGKAVIIGDPKQHKTRALLKRYAEEVAKLHGQFFTGEDVGMTEEDVQYMLTVAPCFIGESSKAGDPSPYAALSAFDTMQVGCDEVFGTADVSGKRVAIKGVGKVGGELLRLLLEAGAQVVAADVNHDRVTQLRTMYPGVTFVDPSVIHEQDVDIYAPCAMGGEFTSDNIKQVKAALICGAANNQLAAMSVGDELHAMGILYVPDVVANAGGLIDVVDELEPGGFQKQRVMERIHALKNTLRTILQQSKEKNESPHRSMRAFAEERFMKKEVTTV